MSKVKFLNIIVLVLMATAVSMCKSRSESQEKARKYDDAPISVTVSIAPQAYIVKRIAGDRVNVNIMVPPNANPETYEPGPKKMVELKDSAIYFAMGLPFEKSWLDRVRSQFPGIVFSNMHRNIPLRKMDDDCGTHHHHHHHHGTHDPHLWMDPVILIQLAQNTVTELLKKDSSNRETYIKNHLELKKELQVLHDEVVDIFKNSTGHSFLVYHPAWGYFAERYGLIQVAVEVDGKEPSASEMAGMIDFIKEKGVEKIFVQKQFSSSVVRSLSEETGVEAVMLDPLEENVIESIRRSAAMIKSGLVK